MVLTESVLIVSCKEKGTAYFEEILSSFPLETSAVKSCASARRKLLENDFDLVLINAPLSDESGEGLAKNIAVNNRAQVILVVKSEFYDAVSDAVEDYGIITVSKPVNRNVLWTALRFAKAADSKLKKMQSENNKLLKKIEDIKIIDRAKCMLVSFNNMSENEAHRHIEKLAMDSRKTRRAIAEGILKTYDG